MVCKSQFIHPAYLKGSLLKQIRLLLLIGLLLLVPVVTAQDDDDISDALLDDLAEIEAATSAVRELEPLTELRVDFPTQAELLAFLTADMETEYTEEAMLADNQFYRAFDWIDADIDLVGLTTDLLVDQIAGFYEPELDVMNVIMLDGAEVGDSLPILERSTYAHEFVHALQDQYFDLNALIESLSDDNPDGALAILSLVEGDATVAGNQYLIQAITSDADLMGELMALDQEALLASTLPPENVPDILFTELTERYFVGADFVGALIEAGGWDLVNDAFTNLPQSMEQIYHPERYLAGEAPIPVTVESGLDALEGDGWVFLFERTFGEFYWREYLANQLSDDVIEVATTGWGGDLYQLYYNAELDQRAWVMNLVMDSVDDGAEFAEAYFAFADARMGVMSMQESARIGCWAGADDALCLFADADAISIGYAPTTAEAFGLVSTQVGVE